MGSFTRLTYHIVFATKYRKRTIKEHLQEWLYEYIGGTIRTKKGHLIEIGGVEDHVHILAGLSPALAVSDVIRDVKAASSKWMKEKGHIDQFEWQKGFGAFTVSYDRVDAIRKYVRNQKEHHKTKTFQDEYIDFLERHGIEFRLEYLFEDEHNGEIAFTATKARVRDVIIQSRSDGSKTVIPVLPPLRGSGSRWLVVCGLTPAAICCHRFATNCYQRFATELAAIRRRGSVAQQEHTS